MGGGILNIIAQGDFNTILTGNPTKTFFKVVYSKYTNFGLQKFRLDYDGNRDLRLNEPSTFTFRIKRYAELLMDTYAVITLPDIWSPIYYPCDNTGNKWVPYDFRWIKNLGTNIIKEIVITCGSLTLQKYSGEYINSCVERDFTSEKKKLFHKMIGHTPELNDPANTTSRINAYPSAYYTSSTTGAEPSIRGRQLFIPLNTWFSLDSRLAFPLIALQYNELIISITMRPVQELFQVRDIFDSVNNYPYIQPDFNQPQFQMYRFLQTPPSEKIDTTAYTNTTLLWNADVHIVSTYCFLSKEEASQFARESQVYLVKDVFEYEFLNFTGTSRFKLTSSGMIASWIWYLQRNDVYMRNEWSNYTNWPYSIIPSDLISTQSVYLTTSNYPYGPFINPDNGQSGVFTTGDYSLDNQKEILLTMGIVFDGDYRENTLVEGIYNYVEKYMRTKGAAKDGIYCYNFCLNTDPFEYQPSGAINLSKFKDVCLEVSTFVPKIDYANSSFDIVCDGTGNVLGVKKQNWRLFEYTFNLKVFEERYNVLSFIDGNAGMLYSR